MKRQSIEQLEMDAEDVFIMATDSEASLVRAVDQGLIRTDLSRARGILGFLEAALNEVLGQFDEYFRNAIQARKYGRAKALTRRALAESDTYFKIAFRLLSQKGAKQQ